MMSSPDSCRWLLVPGPDTWEVWRVGDKGATMERTLDAGDEMSWSAGGGVAVMPAVGSWVMVPMEVPGEDTLDALESMAALRLEGEGIIDEDQGDGVRLFSLQKLESSSAGSSAVVRSLTRDGVDWVDGLSVVPEYVISPVAAMNFPSNAITLQRELGSWVMVVTVGDVPVYYQRCGSGAFAVANGARDFSGVLMSLRMAGVSGIRFLESLVVRVADNERDEYEPVVKPIAKSLGLRLEVEDPRTIDSKFSPAGAPVIKSPGMLAERARRSTRARLSKIAACGAVVWLGLIGYAVWSVIDVRGDAADAEAAAEANSPMVTQLQVAEKRISELDFVMDDQAFPLNVLLQVDALKPSATIRFKDFSVRPNRDLVIKGTAARPDDAIRFGEVLRSARQFVDYKWKTPNPTNSSDNTVAFSFTGTYLIPVVDADPITE